MKKGKRTAWRVLAIGKKNGGQSFIPKTFHADSHVLFRKEKQDQASTQIYSHTNIKLEEAPVTLLSADYADSSPRDALHAILKENDWPLCDCIGTCNCRKNIVPEWMLKYVKVDPFLRCLDMHAWELWSPSFVRGVQLGLRHISLKGERGKITDVTAYFIYVSQFFASNSIAEKESKLVLVERKLNQFEFKTENDLLLTASGFFFARALRGQHNRWIIMRGLEKEHSYVLMDESSISEALQFHLFPIAGMNAWLSEAKKVEHLRRFSIIIQAALFWFAQRLLFTIDDLRKICHKGWDQVSEEYDRGLLIWQQGWTAFPREISMQLLEAFGYFE